MLRFIFSLIDIALIAGGFALAVVDGTRSIGAGKLDVMSFQTLLSMAWPNLAGRLHAGLDQISPRLSSVVSYIVLDAPAFLMLWVLGLLIFALLRKKDPEIGYIAR